MTTSLNLDPHMERLAAGGTLPPEVIRELAVSADILAVGMLADTLRRRLHGTRATFVRVATCPFDRSFADAVPPAAREVHVTGTPDSVAIAVDAVRSARAVAGNRFVSGFSWTTVERLAARDGSRCGVVLDALREAGLEAVAELPLDAVQDAGEAVECLNAHGFRDLRLTIDKGGGEDRANLLLAAASLQERFGSIQSLNPLPMVLHAFRPTTGYEDVRMVAIARLAAPNIPSIQVDWPRYGPKLAQVALTFGADDVYGVSGSDAAPEGRRRAPLEEIRRNIEAAGLEAVERDGRGPVGA